MRNATPGEVKRRHYCRGCGGTLALGWRGLFHPDCLKADKRHRTREKRRQEREKFQAWLSQQRCPRCGAKLGQKPDQRPRLLQEYPCEASHGALETRTAPKRCHDTPPQDLPTLAAIGETRR